MKMRVPRLAWPIVCATLLGASPAVAQAPAVDQYTDPGSSPTARGPLAQERVQADEPSPGAGAPSAPVGPGASTTAAPPAALRISFGQPSGRLVREIDAALVQGGLPRSVAGRVTRARVERFLASPLAGRLSRAGDAAAVGRAVAALVTDPTPLTAPVLRALLGFTPSIEPSTYAVFTRDRRPTGAYGAFQRGIVTGSRAVPRAYAELSTAKPSFVEAFDRLGVSTVDSIDTPSGKTALVAILVSGASGNFGGKPTADAKLVAGEVMPLSATTGGGLGDVTAGFVLLGLVLFAVLWSLPALRRGRLSPR